MDEFALFYPEGHQAHAEPGHPERPERVEAIRKAFETAGIWESAALLAPKPPDDFVLKAIHEPDFLEELKVAGQRGWRMDPDTYLTKQSWQLAQNAAGGGIAVAEAVWQREARRGFALTRPPGHHATRDQAMGFCLLNNIALAAQHLIQHAGAQRLAIIDIDVHHGNGTQDIFWRRGDVFYFSTHQYPLYPGTGQVDEIGTGAGEGATANVPLPPFSGDTALQTAVDTIFVPLLDRFQPQMLLISVGFDAHWRDPLAQLLLSTNGYALIVKTLADWSDANCEGQIALFLEGGYDIEAGALSAAAVTKALLGQPWEDPLGPSTTAEEDFWEPVIARAREIWGL
ncbi:MAG: histone deacetylase [Anaerolineales bacterium]|nr:histone deacetylase [Anaerolineales bacterium]